ncbi:hypothetical protein DITRI_Ditri09bG0083200 [Diplodiscus trichospermus]
MQNSDQERQDQSKTCNIEDSTMTIEFLRASLLSERSVSKSARRRADELARRVAELEEQLKIVSVQRRRAEKATADVLAILENNGVSDISEDFDSSSDQGTHFESNMDNGSTKEKEISVNSRVRRKESEDLSGSDLDFSPVSGRSLSWKDCKSASLSPEKYKDSLMRRCSSFASMGFSSTKHRQCKSCRLIRRRESRLINSGGAKIRYDGEKDMEKALEHQAQLIGHYEAMERAQREWEEKFRENNNSTPDSCDPGNRSDVTEERDEIKAQTQYVSGPASSQVQGAEGELPKSHSNDVVPPSQGDVNQFDDPRCSSSLSPESLNPKSLGQKFIIPVAKENHYEESLQSIHAPLGCSHQFEHAHGSTQSVQPFSSNMDSSSSREPPANKNELYALVPHETSSTFSGVLDALRQARLSLQQKINTLPPIEGASGGKTIEPHVSGRKVAERVEIPVGCFDSSGYQLTFQ